MENQTTEITPKSWQELEAEGQKPINLIGTPYLDETSVPDEKRPIYETVIAAEYSHIEAQAEEQAEQVRREHEATIAALAERHKARQDLTDIAVRGSIVAAINEQPAPQAETSVGTLHDGYLPPNEVEDLLEARRNGTSV